MLRELLLSFVVLLIGGFAVAAGAGIWIITSASGAPESQPTGQVLPAQQYIEVPTLPIVISEKADDTTRFLECKQTHCRVTSEPKDSEPNALFDGTAWYFYQADGSLHKEIGDEDTLLVAPTDIVAPRAIIGSLGAGKIAYWLDNISKDGQGLTELWAYNGQDAGTFIVAEHLVAADVVTTPKWNGAGSALWFLADSGTGKEEKLEFIVANTSPPLVKARFSNAVPEALQHAARQGLVDVTPSGTTLAFAAENEGGRHTLHIVRDGGATEVKQLSGRVAYLQWIGEGQLIYAVQQQGTIEFWRYADATHMPIAKQSGVLLSALADDSSRYIGYAASEGPRQTSLRILDISSGLSRLQSALPNSSSLQVVHVGDQNQPDTSSAVTQLSDGQLIAFVEDQADRIVGEGAKLVRAVVTDKPNTLFIDFRSPGEETERVLITVRDAVHPEWAILGRYESAAGEWNKIRGSGVDPKSLRLYEWEESAGQWILKQTLDN